MMEFNTKESVEALVPHTGKMFLLDRITSYSWDTLEITTEVDISECSMFYDEELGGVPVWISFEYMAQSISALSGAYGKSRNEEPKVGFIMSVSQFKAFRNVFKSGDVVKLKMKQTIRVDMAVTFDGQAYVGDELVATATVNTVEVPDPKKAVGL